MNTLHMVKGVVRPELWPWKWATAAGFSVAALMGLARGDYQGISGFSSTNFGWLVFVLVGGVVYGARLADGRLPWGLVRPWQAGAATFVLCVLAVCVTGLIFLPEQSPATTLTTDAVGRAWVMAVPVIFVGYLLELVKAMRHLLTAVRRSRHS